jgi:hypothetical protein
MLGVMLLLTALGVVAGSAISTQRGNCPAVQSNALIDNNNGAPGNPEFTVPSRTMVQGNPVRAIATIEVSVWNGRFDEAIRKRLKGDISLGRKY